MTDLQKIEKINQTIEAWFKKNPSVKKVEAKDLMLDFIKSGVFAKDRKEGLPIRDILRKLEKSDQLNQIPYVLPRQRLYDRWFFIRVL